MKTVLLQLAGRLTVVRRFVGLLLLFVGILGLLLPIMPGWPLIIPGVALLGRRDPLVRRLHLLLRHTLRWMRHSRLPWLRRAGRRLSLEYLRMGRVISPAIDATERAITRSLALSV